MNVVRLRTCAGLAAAIVPLAIIVHLVAEAVALGPDGLGIVFVMRHGYFALLFVAAAIFFAQTVGIGRSPGERRRRCALARAELRGRGATAGFAALVATNLGFFALTQVVEGVPVAGAFVLSLVIALGGSIGAALLVVFFGRALIGAALDAVIGNTPRRGPWRPFPARRTVSAPRNATTLYSLIRPNRPPPFMSSF